MTSEPYALQLIEADDVVGLRAWDAFLLRTPRGHHSQFSTWLQSYTSYGGTFQVITATSKLTGELVGGLGLVGFGNRWLGFATVSVGPIVDVGHESAASPLVDRALQIATAQGRAYVDIHVPYCAEGNNPALLDRDVEVSGRHVVREMPPLEAVCGIRKMNWVAYPPGLSSNEWRDAMFARFSSSTRRNIRIAENHGVEVREARDEEEIRIAYAVIEQNGLEKGYATRAWSDFGPILCQQIEAGHAVMLMAWHADRVLGAVYCGTAGQRFTDIMAGTVRAKPDLKIGCFIRWSAMKVAHERGMIGYDLTADGTGGVQAAKQGFRPQRFLFVPPRMVVLSKTRFLALTRIAPLLIRWKKPISQWLSRWAGRR